MEIRRALTEDRSRILEISSQIWEGEDYIRWVIDDWYAGPEGEFVVATIDDLVIAFSHRSWLFPGYAWLQGIRTDPAFQGRGAGRAITEHFISGARMEGAERIGLSTYIDNEASIHIIEGYGFKRTASYVYVETPKATSVTEAAPVAEASPEEPIEAVSVDDAEAFVRGSAFLAAAQGRIPSIWKMYPFAEAWDRIAKRVPYWRGIRRQGQLETLIGVTPGDDEEDSAFVSFLDGAPESMGALLRKAAADLRPTHFEMMLPKGPSDDASSESAALRAVRTLDVTVWNDFIPDTFVYEIRL